MEDRGFEPVSKTPKLASELRQTPKSKVTKTEAVFAKSLSSPSNPSTLVPRDLLEVIKTWHDLSCETKAVVLALVRGVEAFQRRQAGRRS